MKLYIQDRPYEFQDQEMTLQGLLEFLQESKQDDSLLPELFALVVNQSFVPRSLYSQRKLQEGDRLHFITPQPGG